MTKTLLIASVAALAITAPAAAERGGHGSRDKGGQAQPQQAAPQQRAARQQAPQQVQRQQMRVERQAQPQVQRQQMRVERQAQPQVQRQQMRVERQAPRVERQAQRQQPRVERQAQRVERHAPHAEREVQRAQMRVDRQAQRVERNAPHAERQVQRAQMRVDRQAQRQQVRVDRQQPGFQRQQAPIERRAARSATRDDRQALRQQQRAVPANTFMPGRGFAPHNDGAVNQVAARQQVRAERQQQRIAARAVAPAPMVTIGQRFDPATYGNRYAPLGYSAAYPDTADHYYRYDGGSGYLYQVRRSDNVVSSLVPLLGGAFSVGQPMPYAYRSYNVPSAYSSLYYNSPDAYYGYGGGAIYQVDPQSQLIQSVVQLLSGNSLGVGQVLPANYGVYNVPDAYRGRYYDTADSWYRYNDGYIYQVDPYSRRIEDMYPAYYGAGYGGYGGGYYGAGSAFPMSYADYNVPYGYRDLYYDTPQYDYRYANGGIYQLDAGSQVIQALVALVSGRNFGVGQVLPASYGVYNVPDAYRGQYYDTADSWYRYNDGNIYQVAPLSRVIQRIVPVSYGAPYAAGSAPVLADYGYDGYLPGAVLPAQYGDYNVPYPYRDAYYDTPQYDYRYANGAIYQLNPQSRVIQSLVALVGSEGLGIGQTLPAGYGVYNVPDAYRARYADSADSWYRYADGYVYQVDPRTRVINGMFDVV